MRNLLRRILERIFLAEHMEKQLMGPLPSSKELYIKTIRMAWPAVAESVLVGLTGIVDTIMVGGLGTAAIASVGLTTQPKFILYCLVFSLNIGVTALVSRRTGEGNMEAANRCMRQAVLLSAVISLVVCSLSYLFAEPFVLACGAKPDTVVNAAAYLRILAVGMVFQNLCSTINAAQRAVGNTKISMRTGVTSNLVNVVFNYLLIGGNFGFPRLEVRGAALATALGCVIAFLMAARSVFNGQSTLRIYRRQSFRLEKAMMKSLWDVSSSALAEQLCMRVGFFIFSFTVANLGTAEFATHQICINISTLSFTVGDGLAMAAAALVGQGLGQKRPDLSSISAKICQRVAFMASTLLASVFILLRFQIVDLFSNEASVIQAGAQIMLVIAAFCHAQTSSVVYTGALRGAGDTRFTARLSLVTSTFVRPGMGYFYCYIAGLGLVGAWLGMLTEIYIRVVVLLIRFRRGKWKTIVL